MEEQNSQTPQAGQIQQQNQAQSPEVSASTASTQAGVPTATNSLPPIKVLFSQSWEVFTASLLRLFLLGVASIVITIILAIVAIMAFVALGVGTNLFQSLQEAGPAALAAIPKNTYIVGGIIVLAFVLVQIIVGAVLKAATMIVIAEYNQQTSIGNAIGRGFGFVVPLFLAGALGFVFAFGGLLLFIIPAILFYFFFAFVSYEIVLNGQGFYSAFKRSMLIVSRRFDEILVRLIVLALLYILIAFVVPGLINRAVPETMVVVGLMSFLINSLFGWFGLAYLVTLYKQARSGLEGEEGKSLIWIWVIAILGWIIAGLIGFAGYKLVSTTDWREIFEEEKTEVEVRREKERYTAKSIEKSLEEMSPEAKIHFDISQQLFEQMQQNAEDPEIVQQINDQNIEELKAAVEIEPDNPRLWIELGHAYTWISSEGTLEDGLTAYKKAEELDPENIVFINNVGDMLIRLERYEEAILQFQKTFRKTEKSGFANLSIGIAYKQLGMNDVARTRFEKAIEIFEGENTDGSYDDEILRARKELAGLE